DRRRMLVWLTPAGQDVLAEERRVLDRGLLARAIAAMADGDRRKLIDGMRALVAAAGPRKETSQWRVRDAACRSRRGLTARTGSTTRESCNRSTSASSA